MHMLPSLRSYNYCFRNPASVNCAGTHLISNCPTSSKIDEVKCYNCRGNHSVSYKGIIRNQLQQKLYPTHRAKHITDTATPPAQSNNRNNNINNTYSHSFTRTIS